MAYYDAFITKWATFTGTTTQKLLAVNVAVATGSVPATFTCAGADILNAIDWTEFNALATTKQLNLLTMCAVPGGILGGSANTAHMAAGMILASFTTTGPTVAGLTALAKAVVQPWWQANGYPRAFDMGDVTAAGLS